MGEKLFSEVTEATGLPNETISRELAELITSAGYDKETLTLDQLRHALAEYVQDILLEAKDDLNKIQEDEQAITQPRPLRS
jgi:hypothetical protein